MSTVSESLQPLYTIQATAPPAAKRTRVLKQDDTFGVFDEYGDVDAETVQEEGIFHKGARFLSKLQLKLLGHRPVLLSSTVRQDNVILAADLTNPGVFRDGALLLPHGTIHVRRSQFLWHDILYMNVEIRNFSLAPIDIGLLLEFAADFADIFEVRGETRPRRGVLHPARLEPGAGNEQSVVLAYDGLDNVPRRTIIRSSPPVEVVLPSTLHFSVHLIPHEQHSLEFTFAFQSGDHTPQDHGYEIGREMATVEMAGPDRVPALLSTSNRQFDTWLERSRMDLNMLLTAGPYGTYPYGGVPWFSTPFGRDGIVVALECLWIAPQIARGVLAYLTATQAKGVAPEQDAEPGKILHEARDGEMPALGEVPFRRYYGSIDATPLYLLLAGAYYQRTADLEFIQTIWAGIELALLWLDRYGDVDGDGFIEYSRHSSKGLVQQGWKDSQDSIFHANGELARAPIALCEVQGYVYAAKLGIAAVAAALGKSGLAERLRSEADDLRNKFEAAFWSEALGAYAIALDGDKRPCEVMTSNAGQCLFSGIASQAHAVQIVQQLESDVLFSGWGIRTVAEGEARFNPMSYHNGSVWPHDNALIASGLARYRLTAAAAKILGALFEASTYFDFDRLPELFCGFSRRPGKAPTLYPVACSPQAWSAGAAFLLLEASIGLSIDAPRRRVAFTRPVLPPFLEQVKIRNLTVANASLDLVLFRSGAGIAVTVENRSSEDIEIAVFQ